MEENMKKTKFIMKAKRLLSGFVATVIAVSMLPTLPAMAEETTEKYPYTLFAGSSEEGAITVNAGNFCVNGNVATNGTIVSSGNMNINGTKAENAGEETIYILKKLNYAYFSGDNVDVYPDDYSYEEMNININDPMAVQGELELTGNINLNTGVKALEDVNLNGEVKNTSSSVICSETGDIVIDSTNVNLNGLVYAPYGDVEITAQNLNLNNVIIIADTITFNCPSVNANYSSSMAELVGIESDIEVELYAFGEYSGETNSIDIEWYTNYTNSDYEVLISDDNISYSSVATITDATTYHYLITDEFETRYFKISLTTNYGEKIESIPFVATKSENGYIVDFLDSDGDGLADFIELMYGTDINKSDTDEDDLTDYQEIYLTDTNPLKFDSVTDGVSDAQADSDSDGLTNKQEIELGTDVNKPDTDDDGLSDDDEINIYVTDPLNPDTDADDLIDGDEPHIGLDPTNPETFGVPDAEYKITQTISADSEALSEINTAESPYKLSIDITASGYVEGNLTAKKTSYSKAIQNDSMLGIAPELIYASADSIDTVTLKFEISSEYVENTLNMFPDEEELIGIKRLNVFKYFEDLNMLIPIETQFDIENNIVYTNADELGTYCVMDMELWLNSFEVPEEAYLSTPMLMSLPLENDIAAEFTTNDSIITFDGEIEDMVLSEDESETEMVLLSETPMLMSLNTVTNVTPIDVAFLLQSSGQLENTFTSQKTMILDVMEKLIDEYGDGNVRFCVVTYNLSGADMLEFTDGEIWFTNYYALCEALNAVSYTYTSGYTDRGNAFRMLQNNVDFRENASKFIFQVMNGSTDVGSMYFDQINTCSRLGINYSELMPSGYYYLSPSYGQQVADAIASTNGLNATYSTDSSNHVYNHICEYAAPPQVEFNAIVPTGWKTISLNGILDSENGVKSDDDTLTDWEEVMTEKLSWDTDGTVILPTIQKCISYATKPYAEDGLARFKSDQWISGMPSSDFERYLYYVINNTYILPIYSDPTNEDTDGDGLLDINDPAPMTEKNYGSSYITMNDEQYVKILQQCLEYLGYLDMDGNSYGTFGGLTSAATQLYQVNHRMYSKNVSLEITEYVDVSSESETGRTIMLDEVTFYSIIREALNCGFEAPNDTLWGTISVTNSYTFFKNKFIPQSVPLEEVNVSLNYDNPVYIKSVESKLSSEKANIYIYDLTVPLEGMLRLGAQEFHFHHYTCNAVNSWVESMGSNYLTYTNSSKRCRKNRSDFAWLILNVANDKRYDVKKENSWNSFFYDLNLNVPYYHSSTPFVFKGEEINAEILGNILYGYAGNAGGYAQYELSFGGSLYSKATTGEWDNEEDSTYVKKGFDMYDDIKRDYTYLHITK